MRCNVTLVENSAIAIFHTHFCMIASKKRSEAERSVQSTFLDTAYLSINSGENIAVIVRGNVKRMRAIVGAIKSAMSCL
jgi:hypothetical protein